MFSGAEVVALLTAVLTPILGGFSALFVALLKQMEGRLKDATRAQETLADTYKARLADATAERERVEQDRDHFRAISERSVNATEEAADTSERALHVATATRRGER